MKLPEFIESGRPRWDRLAALTADLPRLTADQVLETAELYRVASADLAEARRRFPGDPVTDRLERLVRDARSAVYGGSGRREGLVGFFADTYWRLIRERSRPLALALALLLAPAVFGVVWASTAPGSLRDALPPQFLWVTSAQSTDQGYGAVGLVGFSTFVLTNNVRVTFTAFALGVTWGVGTAVLLVQNGLIFGALAGLAVSAGNWRVFLAAVMAHGILELSCVVVAGASGLSLGRSILRPGPSTRREALAREGGAAVRLALGTAVWLVVAGFVEGFGSRTGMSWLPTTVIGVSLGATFWGLVVVRGRPVDRVTPAPAISP